MSKIKYTNKLGISAALTVPLMYDDYDGKADANTISATSILKSLRQIILTRRYAECDRVADVSDFIASAMGTAIHDRCEKGWKDPKTLDKAVKLWNLNSTTADRIKINPETVNKTDIPVYIEQRTSKKIGDITISGKFDLVLDGTLNDFKSTSTWTYIYDSNADKYTKQGSVYKWLNPDKIKSDYININFIFTDWSGVKAKQDRNYPQSRVLTKKYPLMSIEETEQWLTSKLESVKAYDDKELKDIPLCSEEELWAKAPVFKYYKNPNSRGRATKNFDTLAEAELRKAKDNNVGVIVSVPAAVKACLYCPIMEKCDQAKRLIEEGRLKID